MAITLLAIELPHHQILAIRSGTTMTFQEYLRYLNTCRCFEFEDILNRFLQFKSRTLYANLDQFVRAHDRFDRYIVYLPHLKRWVGTTFAKGHGKLPSL